MLLLVPCAEEYVGYPQITVFSAYQYQLLIWALRHQEIQTNSFDLGTGFKNSNF